MALMMGGEIVWRGIQDSIEPPPRFGARILPPLRLRLLLMLWASVLHVCWLYTLGSRALVHMCCVLRLLLAVVAQPGLDTRLAGAQLTTPFT